MATLLMSLIDLHHEMTLEEIKEKEAYDRMQAYR